MPVVKKANESAAVETPLLPADALKARLIGIAMSSKRFAPEEAWMRDAITVALDAKLTAKLADLTDEQVTLVNSVLSFAK